MSEHIGIAELAIVTGVSAHTLRYYERAGLMLPVPRDPAGRRIYTPEHVQWVRFLRRLRSGGMPIGGIRRYVELTLQDSDNDGSLRLALLERHRSDVARLIDELREHLEILDRKLAEGCAPGEPR